MMYLKVMNKLIIRREDQVQNATLEMGGHAYVLTQAKVREEVEKARGNMYFEVLKMQVKMAQD